MKEFVKSIMKDSREVFSIDRITNKEEGTTTLIVLFEDNTCKSFTTTSNNWMIHRAYRDLRKHKLNLRI